MFKYFKEKMPAVTNAATAIIEAIKNEPNVVLEIHNEFDIASQRAVDEAKKILGSFGNPEIKKQVDVLIAAGFNNVPMIVEWNKEKSKRDEAQRTMTTVEKYALKYPSHKFIFIDQVKEICKKYNLLCVPVGKYKGEVPHKNILEIAAFKAKAEDTYLEEGSFRDRVEYDFSNRHKFKNANQVMEIKAQYEREMSRAFTMDRMAAAMYPPHFHPSPSYNSVPLFICAPKGDLIINKDDKLSNEVFMTREIKDPIVLHYVGDGFLVVTKWGLEASDETLVNQKMN